MNITEITAKTKIKKDKFLLRLFIYTVSYMFISAALILLVPRRSDSLLFCLLLLFAFVFLIVKLVRRYDPAVLFSREISGINLKEDEYVNVRYRNAGAFRNRIVGGAKTGGRQNIRAAIYVQLDNGNVKLFNDIPKNHVDIFEIGDKLYKPAGARYFVVIDRVPHLQPCPMCGSVNKPDAEECFSCGTKNILLDK